ncbi:ATP-binding cassette domain-containing protein [Bradyrhizobium tropiciagri]|nr:ATP-binding cassette domain-containing protein [Bradyrhizobium tropiciagri]
MASSGETHRGDAAAVLRVESLTVQYGALVALRDVSWSVDADQILGIIGPNGAGKSSCFAAVTNAVSHRGRVFLEDNDVSSVRTFDLASRGLRRTFQQNSFFGELTVLQNAAAAIVRDYSANLATSLFMPWREMATRRHAELAAAQLLDFFGIAAQYHHQLPGDIPYGVQRLLSVALAYGTGAKVLLLDEPAAGLSGGDMKKLADVLISLRKRKLALVVIEHHMDLIMSIADRIVMIDQGVMLATGAPAEIQRDPLVREAYLGRDE